MTTPSLPILPTTVVGSYAIPAWLWAAYEKIEAGGFGAMDLAETENDALETAIRDQGPSTGVGSSRAAPNLRESFILRSPSTSGARLDSPDRIECWRDNQLDPFDLK